MKLDPKTVRLFNRLTDRMNLIRKHPNHYEIADDDFVALLPVAQRLEGLLDTIKTVKLG